MPLAAPDADTEQQARRTAPKPPEPAWSTAEALPAAVMGCISRLRLDSGQDHALHHSETEQVIALNRPTHARFMTVGNKLQGIHLSLGLGTLSSHRAYS